MGKQDAKQFCPKNELEWRSWLQENHQKEDSVWLVFYRKSSPNRNLSWSEAVDQALCFGWIDSVKRKLDEERFEQYFTKRKVNSTWSRVNKDKIEVLTKKGLMTTAGQESIEVAKENGSWNILDSIDQLIVPEDLETEFAKNPRAKEAYENLSTSLKRGVLYKLVSAKRKETRDKRISEIVQNLLNGKAL